MDIISQADLDYEGEKREGNISRTSNIWVRSYLLHLYLIIRKTKKPPKQEKGCVCVCACVYPYSVVFVISACPIKPI